MFSMSERDVRLACIVLLGITINACSRDAAPTATATTDGASHPMTSSPPAEPDAIRDAAVDAADTPVSTRLAKADPAPRIEREDDYYPAPARQLDSELMKNMRLPYTDLGRAEARYFSGKLVDSDVMSKALRKRDFDSQVLDLQSGGASDAVARTRAYGAALQVSLQPYAGRAQLGRFGCGTVLCMGSISTRKADWLPGWSARIHDQPLPMPSLSINTIRVSPDRYEVRFAFTTRGQGGFVTRPR
jgi:hypothetical protein